MKLNLKSVKKRILKALGKSKPVSTETENHGKHLITSKSSMRILEAYRMARTNLFYSGNNEDGGVVFGVTSASPSDGKSLTCANLAISFSMSGKRVLLIDCDMRKPTQKKAFGVHTDSGLSEYLAGVVETPNIVDTSYENLSLLTSGRCPPNPAELLYRPRLAELIASVRESFDFIFVDLPPVEMISDATIVHPYIQSYILVIRMKKSDYHLVQGAIESIEKVDGKIAGIVMNDVEDRSESYRYKSRHYGRYGRYYRRYYSKYGSYISGEQDKKTGTAEAPAQPATEAPASETAEKAGTEV